MSWLVGVDEAGRGPLAGPVMVGVVAVPIDFDWRMLAGVDDSKKLSAKKREVLFNLAHQLQKEDHLNFAVGESSAALIDKKGIVGAVEAAMAKALTKLSLNPDHCEIRLDGSLRAPAIYQNQITIIGGDGLEPVIGLASILAKVTRDRYMEKMANKPEFSSYEFGKHKGYGTKAHRTVIQEQGLSLIHRRSFCRNLPHNI